MHAARSDLPTVVAIAIAAFASCDLVHEALGHGVAALAVPGVRVVSLTTVALQTAGINSRVVAAAGPLMNVFVGVVALALFHRTARVSAAGYFLWLFAALNLMNGTGYLIFSAVLGGGDWAVVVSGFEPAWLWRLVMGLVGAAAYAAAVWIAARELARAVEGTPFRRADVAPILFSSYVAGGALLLLASIFNPISPSLILVSGLSAGFGAMAGLTLVPKIVERRAARDVEGDVALSRSRGWIVAGLATATFFVGVVGPGIRF
jgi:hypothetical protein